MNIQIQVTCSTLLEAAKLFNQLVAATAPGGSADNTKDPEPTEATSPKSVEAPKARAKREPKAKPSKATATVGDDTPTDDEPVITREDLSAALHEALEAIGDVAVRAIFKKHKIAKLIDLPEASYPAFVKALNAAKEMAS